MSQAEANPRKEPTRPFSIVLGQLEDGTFHDDVSEKLRELTLALKEHAATSGNAKGKLTLTLDLMVDKGLLLIVPNVETRAPRPRRKSSVMWITDEGNLSPDNPKQLPLVPRAVPALEEKPREVSAHPMQVKEA